jgi:hypothetical protein
LSKQAVIELLSRRAKCPVCGHILTEASEKMQRASDAWLDFLIAINLSFEAERQNSLRYGDAILETIHCLHNLAIATEPLLIDVPEPCRSGAAVKAVRNAFSAAFPHIDCPDLGDRLADAIRPHLHEINLFWRSD